VAKPVRSPAAKSMASFPCQDRAHEAIGRVVDELIVSEGGREAVPAGHAGGVAGDGRVGNRAVGR